MNDISRTIKWADKSWNPVAGCFNRCPYCYARRIAQRFPKNFPEDFKPTFYQDRLWDRDLQKDGSRVFVCSGADLFHKDIPEKWIADIFNVANQYNQHKYLFLTKNPIRYREFNLAPHFWLGQTVDGIYSHYQNIDMTNTFVSAEPLLVDIAGELDWKFDWLIIGAQTGAGAEKAKPKKEWVEKLIKKAREHNIPIFLKDNLQWSKIQEFPKEIK